MDTCHGYGIRFCSEFSAGSIMQLTIQNKLAVHGLLPHVGLSLLSVPWEKYGALVL